MINIAEPQMGPEEKQAVLEVLDSGMIAYVVGCATYYPVPIHPALRGDDLRAVVKAANSFPRVA